MILNRIVQNVRNQNWSTLGLELLVVMAGIFLGLQADSWTQSRSEKKELSTYLQALSDELGSTAWMRRNYVGWHDDVIDGLRKAIERTDGTQLTPEDLQRVYYGLTYLATPPTSPQRFAVLSAMQADGMLRLIVDPKLRQILGEILSGIRSEYAEYDRYVESIYAPEFSAEIVEFGIGADGDGEVLVTNVDWDAASADPAFLLRLHQGLRIYMELRRSHKNKLLVHEQALDMLAKRGFQPSVNWVEENEDDLTAR